MLHKHVCHTFFGHVVVNLAVTDSHTSSARFGRRTRWGFGIDKQSVLPARPQGGLLSWVTWKQMEGKHGWLARRRRVSASGRIYLMTECMNCMASITKPKHLDITFCSVLNYTQLTNAIDVELLTDGTLFRDSVKRIQTSNEPRKASTCCANQCISQWLGYTIRFSALIPLPSGCSSHLQALPEVLTALICRDQRS